MIDDDIARDHDEHTKVSDSPQQVAERERRESQHWRVEKYSKPIPAPDTEPSRARANWGLSLLIIAGLSAVCWAVIALSVIALLSAL